MFCHVESKKGRNADRFNGTSMWLTEDHCKFSVTDSLLSFCRRKERSWTPQLGQFQTKEA